MDELRVGIIGTGIHGSRYANHIRNDVAGLVLTAISRRSEDGLKQAHGWQARYYQDWRELVAAPEVDAVVAVTVPALNLDIARFCAEMKKPLLLEKPLARNGGEGRELVRVMAEAGCPLTIGQTLRYNPVVAALREQLAGLGQLYSLAVNQRLEPSMHAWHDDPQTAGAGVIIHTAVHVFDALRLITGLNVRRVMAIARCIHNQRLEDLVAVLFEMENGVVGTLDVSKIGTARSGRYEFICRDGQLHGDQIHGFTEIIRNSQVKDRRDLAQIPTILPLLEGWRDFLRSGQANPVSGEDGLYAVEVCDACLRSAREQRWVNV